MHLQNITALERDKLPHKRPLHPPSLFPSLYPSSVPPGALVVHCLVRLDGKNIGCISITRLMTAQRERAGRNKCARRQVLPTIRKPSHVSHPPGLTSPARQSVWSLFPWFVQYFTAWPCHLPVRGISSETMQVRRNVRCRACLFVAAGATGHICFVSCSILLFGVLYDVHRNHVAFLYPTRASFLLFTCVLCSFHHSSIFLDFPIPFELPHSSSCRPCLFCPCLSCSIHPTPPFAHPPEQGWRPSIIGRERRPLICLQCINA